MDSIKVIVVCILITTVNAQKVPFYNIATTKPKEIKILNSEYRETNIALSPDGNTMFFMSTRGNQSWSRITITFKGQLQYDGDIWKSIRINNKWQEPICLKPPINTPYGEDEPIVINDSTIIYQSWRIGWETSGGPYYKIILGDSIKLIGLNSGITKFFIDSLNYYGKYATDGAYLTPDYKRFYFSANYDYNGKMDIFFSELNNNTWSYPKKSNASTSGDERSIFITKNGKFIFFASDSYNSIGGYDIFVGEIDPITGNIINIKNLGPPINSPHDEYSFVINPADTTEAFFVRNGDIYTVKLKPIKKLPTLQIHFAFDSDSIITPVDSLKNIIEFTKTAKKIILIGHTDTIGTKDYNALLGIKRANKVKKLLINSGVPAEKIITISKGEDKPLYYIPEKNRRVEVILKY